MMGRDAAKKRKKNESHLEKKARVMAQIANSSSRANELNEARLKQEFFFSTLQTYQIAIDGLTSELGITSSN